MTSFLASKILNKIGNNQNEVLKRSNQLAASIMLLNTFSQIYLRNKKGANWQFPIYYEKNVGYDEDYIDNLLKERLSVTDGNVLIYRYNDGSYSNLKPVGCGNSVPCGSCEIMKTRILNGSNFCKKKITDVGVADTMILFSGLTFLSHCLISTILFKKYLIWIKKDKTNFLRWIEYSITSSVMILGISGLTGIISIEELLPIFILTGVTNMFGLAIESIKSKKKKYKNVRKLMFLSGTITQLYPWYRILQIFRSSFYQQNKFYDNIQQKISDPNYDFGSNQENKDKIIKALNKDIDRFKEFQNVIRNSTLSLFVSYFTFPIIMYKQYFTGPITGKKYLNGELQYIAASIISKSSLAWQIFGGAFRTD